MDPYRQETQGGEGMNSPPSTSRDCRPYFTTPQTVKKLLEQKRQQKSAQASASCVEYNQEVDAAGSFAQHSPQDNEDLLFPRHGTHYNYPVLEDLYPSGSGTLYGQERRYEGGRRDIPSVDPEMEVSFSSSTYVAPFSHDASWSGHSQASYPGADPFLRVPGGAVVPDMVPLDLEDARVEIQNLSPDQLLIRDEDGDTILHLYVARGLRSWSYAVAERYLQYGQLDTREHNGKSPLLVAAAANQPEIVYDLITLGADVNASDCKGQTVLHVAATYGFSDVLRVLVSLQRQQNFDVEVRNYDGLTPLHCAVISLNSVYNSKRLQPTQENQQQERERMTCVQLLLQLGASCASQDIKSSKTVLHLAVQAGNIPLVKFLLNLPHTDLPALINLKAHGNTALHMAAALPPHQSAEYLIQLLLSLGGDPSMRNLENEQPVHLVPPGELSDQIKLLLKRRRITSSTRHQSSSSL
uniref:NFKB inhibitor delta S homeolog n=1 Tax=Xenopus laevis TaxID=8355 RepID=UPI0039A67A36